MSKRIAAIIQARMNSTRLPGKVMLPIMNKPVLQWMIERVAMARKIDKIIVATTPSSPEIIRWLHSYTSKPENLYYFIGSENDVMDRVLKCARTYEIDTIVDLTSDCPLVDPGHIDELIFMKQQSKSLYASNIIPRTWFDGNDIQIYDTNLLASINPSVVGEFRQHTGWNITQDEFFKATPQIHLNAKGIYNWPGLRLTLDYPEDFEVIRSIIRGFCFDGSNRYYSAEKIVDYVLAYPEILVNKHLFAKEPGE